MFHEGKTCDALVRYLEQREGGMRQEVRRPDQEGDPDPIELSLRINGRLYAIEHTGIEPFDRQIEFGHADRRFFDPVVKELKKNVPDGECYSVHVPAGAARRVKSNAVGPTQQKLVAWVLDTAPKLRLIETSRLDMGCRNVSVAQIPFPVSLSRQRRPSTSWPSVALSYVADSDEDARQDRIEIGFKKKLPKLMAWKKKQSARTVLVFENNDIQLTNHIVVAEALLKIVANSPNRPDEIYLVSSCQEPWQVIAMLVDEVSVFGSTDDWMWQVDSSLLEDITGR